MTKNIAIFASGEGTNAQNMMDYFKSSDQIKIALIVSNKPTANVLNRAKANNVPTLILDKKTFFESNTIVNHLKDLKIDLIVLAGFLWIIPENLINAFPDKIVNIHPSLLPKYGGKGMYGMKVHEAVIEAKEKQSGISIHFVNEKYDEGEIIEQHTCSISENDTAEILAQKIHQLEQDHFPKAIEKVLLVK
ncbi:MAG: phosphoribosylglycinamide formyltransferase [Bacteroidetes bacterium]|nr:phosphoribosylglycinamide formyltransferase [Bacteroidota bacterium]